MNSIKVAVIYHSSTGTNYKLAQTAREAAGLVGAETRLRKIQTIP